MYRGEQTALQHTAKNKVLNAVCVKEQQVAKIITKGFVLSRLT